jgi:hypothetical protein
MPLTSPPSSRLSSSLPKESRASRSSEKPSFWPFHGGQRGLGNLVGQGRDVAGDRQEGGAARGGLYLHEDGGDRDQQADEEDTTQDAELRIDGQMADQRQLALAAPVDQPVRRRRQLWGPWAFVRSKLGSLKGSLKAMVFPLRCAQSAISR